MASKDFDTMEDSNRSCNPSIHDVSDPARRTVLRGTLGVAVAALYAPLVTGCAAAAGSAREPARAIVPSIGFKGVAVDASDKLQVPEGYTASVIAAWGEPVGVPGNMPAWKGDGSHTAAEQAVQMGMHHDGMEFFPLEGNSSVRGLLAMNHEYTDDGLLHSGGLAGWNAEKVRKSQAAHGLSVIEVALKDGQWDMVRPSRYARRFTANTPFAIGGPCAGHAMMKTAADAEAKLALGTFNNCASSKTPWGTYLSGEENWMGYFSGGDNLSEHEKRWGMRKGGSGYNWHAHDERFDAVKNPNEPNRHGWVVEVDPYDPTATPIKRTALGRAAHEGAWAAVTKDGRAVIYSGEDARFEYIYKFVSRDKIKPGGAKPNATLLDHGTLHVARFNADGSGQWIAMVHGQGPLTAANGFADQGEVLIKARQASDILGATKMDRPEWLAIDPLSGWVYCTLTNNSSRGMPNFPGVDAANPRANNAFGQIIRWQEDRDFDAGTFKWNHLVLAGDPANERAEAKGNTKGDLYACPDGIAFDARGVLWIQTDAHATQMYKGELKNVGNNQMLACDPRSGDTRRFLTGPTNCEVTGATWTPDGRTLFINIQHPGETPSDRSDPAEPSKYSNWPDFKPGGRPRSATVVIRRKDGGVIGT
jgi:secreted PhoX family phosphatase